MNFTFLTKDQLFGTTALEAIKKYGHEAAPTDLAIVLGSPEYESETGTSDGEPTCDYWTATCHLGEYVSIIGAYGTNAAIYPADSKETCVRPALSPAETAKIHPDKRRPAVQGVECCTYGEYPQTVVNPFLGRRLEIAYKLGKLKKDNTQYTFNATGIYELRKPFKEQPHPVFEYRGKRYIRVIARAVNYCFYLSNGTHVKNGHPYWIKVQPVEYLKDPTGWWVARRCLLTGIEFNNDFYKGDFSKTFMKRYLDTYFAKESLASRQKSKKRQKPRTITVHAAPHKAFPNCCRMQNEH